ncbi:MAG: DNA repair protein RecO [Oscillospiraceae bacterium]|nr:DNA repair protein RecO [Oscillospiraceae bacterium]
MIINTDGIVIDRTEAGDTGYYLKVLSPEKGLIDVTVRGAKKQNSANGAASQLFACSKMSLSLSKGRYYMSGSEPIRSFYGIRLDIKKLSLAAYFSEVVRQTVTGEQTARDIYRLFTNSMYMLSEKEADCGFVKAVFELRLCADLGMMPGLLGCDECYKTENKMYFLIDGGILLCPKHMDTRRIYPGPYSAVMSAGVVEAMRHICLSDMGKIFSFRVSERAMAVLSDVAERYAEYHTGRHYGTLDYYKKIE